MMKQVSAVVLLVVLAFPALATAFMAPALSPASTLAANRLCPAPRLRTPQVSGLKMQDDVEKSKLFVGGIPWALTSEDLKEAFEEFGEVKEAKVVYDHYTGRSRGFGFVEFAEQDQAKEACDAMDGSEIGGRNVNVNFAQPRPPRQDRERY